MTKVFYNTNEMYIRVRGHAGAAPAGEDLICAGISALTQALLNQLREEEEQKHIQLDWVMFPGIIEIKVKPDTEHYRRAVRDYFKVIIMGLKAIQEQKPGYIELKEVR